MPFTPNNQDFSMTALNAPLISKIERHLFNVSRLGSQTFGPVIADSVPGPSEVTLCIAAAGVCAQVEIMIDRRFTVFRATAQDNALLSHVREAKNSLRMVARLIEAKAGAAALQAELEEAFDQLAGAITVLTSLRKPVNSR